MNLLKIALITLAITMVVKPLSAQNVANVDSLIKRGNLTKLSKTITSENINECRNLYTPLSLSIKYRTLEVFNWLLKNGADVNKACDTEKSPVFLVCKYGDVEMLKMLVSNGAKVDIFYDGGDYGKETLVQYATRYSQVRDNSNIIQYLKNLTSKIK